MLSGGRAAITACKNKDMTSGYNGLTRIRVHADKAQYAMNILRNELNMVVVKAGVTDYMLEISVPAKFFLQAWSSRSSSRQAVMHCASSHGITRSHTWSTSSVATRRKRTPTF